MILIAFLGNFVLGISSYILMHNSNQRTILNNVILIAKFKSKNNFNDAILPVIFGTVNLVAVWSSRS